MCGRSAAARRASRAGRVSACAFMCGDAHGAARLLRSTKQTYPRGAFAPGGLFLPRGDGAPRGASPLVRSGPMSRLCGPGRGRAFSGRGCAKVPAPPGGPIVAGTPCASRRSTTADVLRLQFGAGRLLLSSRRHPETPLVSRNEASMHGLQGSARVISAKQKLFFADVRHVSCPALCRASMSLRPLLQEKTWMAGTSPAMTECRRRPLVTTTWRAARHRPR
jgi:hypothetical protein